jgi:hypothetical protein
MPPRRGLFGRIADWFRGTPERPEPQYEPLPTPEPPLAPLPPPPSAESEHDQHMREIFEDVTGSDFEYDEWREVYDPMSLSLRYTGNDEEDDENVETYWDEFLRAYYLTSAEPGSVSREQFHQDTGIPESRIDWGLWKSIKRGTP